jgi:hypothetical protein
MKGFFGMSQFIAHVRHATFKNTSKVAWDKRATNTCKKKIFVLILNLKHGGKSCACQIQVGSFVHFKRPTKKTLTVHFHNLSW